MIELFDSIYKTLDNFAYQFKSQFPIVNHTYNEYLLPKYQYQFVGKLYNSPKEILFTNSTYWANWRLVSSSETLRIPAA